VKTQLARVIGGVLIAALASSAVGQSARSGGSSSGGGSTAQQVIAQMQQVARERTEAQTEAAKAKQDLASAQDELKKLHAELDALKSRSVDADQLARAQREAQQATADLERVRNTVSELNRQLHDTALQLRDSETAHATLKSTLAAEVRVHETCVRDNAELGALTVDTLSRYEKRAGSGEPFFKLAQARAQNLVDEYRAKVEDLKAPRPTADATAAAH
jgi:chromosome segregation ATPase